jgi:UV DNA damage endonuclease
MPASTNRTLRLANLPDVEILKGLVRKNISDLKRILWWNAEHGVGLFRMEQNLIPFASHRHFLTTGRPSMISSRPTRRELLAREP